MQKAHKIDYPFVSINTKMRAWRKCKDTVYLSPDYPGQTLALLQLQIQEFSKKSSFQKGPNAPAYR